jgi:O-antigen/teichoic acid export membrane protein
MAISGLVGILLVPIMLAGLGMERYGVWLTVLAVSDIAGGLGFGLGLSLVREVAASVDGGTADETARFVCSSRNIYLLMGVVVVLGLAALSGVFSAGLHLSPATRALVLPAFALIGLAFVGEQLSAFSLAVLAGLRRFDLIGVTAIIGTISNGVFTFLLLRAGRSLVALAMLRAVLALVTALVTSIVIFMLRPAFGRWTTSIDARPLRSQCGFIVASQANCVIGKAVFDGVVPLIGFLLGAASIVPYRIGLKFPQFLGVVSGRIAEVLYPASSEYDRRGDSLNMQDALRWGTRVIVVANVPVLATLFVLAPYLLHVWIPASPPESVTILRVCTFAVLFDVTGYTADNLLWGAGLAQVLLKTCWLPVPSRSESARCCYSAWAWLAWR